MSPAPTCSFDRLQEIEPESPTLIEGLPGLGLVAAIAVDQVTRQLGLEHVGNLHSETFPTVASFEDGLVNETVRVYAGTEPAVMTLQSTIPVPSQSTKALASCVLQDLAREFHRAVFLVGSPAQSEEEIGKVRGVATNEAQRGELEKAGISIAQEAGAIGGPTGALLKACYRSNIPAAALVVSCHPKLPDPGAARSVIEEALEPLLGFDIETTELKERHEEIMEKLEGVAQQFQQAQQQATGGQGQAVDDARQAIYR